MSVRIAGGPGDPGRFVFTCEHASNRLPVPYVATAADRRLLDDHWGWDPGAAELTQALRASMGGVAVLSDFTRLLVDPNRPTDAPDLVRREAESHRFSFNESVDAAEVKRRLARFHAPYHATIEAMLEARSGRDTMLFSLHSFTPVYEGRPRAVELGVLFELHDDLAARMADLLGRDGFVVALNEPYSGKSGLAHSVHFHGTAHGVPYLELEVRNDLLRPGVERVAASVERALRDL